MSESAIVADPTMDIHTDTEALITIAEEYTATAIIVTEVGTIINPKVMDGFEKVDLSPIYFASDSERGVKPIQDW